MSKALYSVTGLVRYIKGTFDTDSNLQSILVKGEVSNFTNHRSGHWYFSLKDSKAKISCVMFASYASRTKFLLKEGMKVIVSANVSMYEASGSTQLYVTAVQQDGLGDLYLQLEAVKEKLRLEGCFELSLKKTLPLYPASIGIITAKTGAAVQDILTTISRRWPIAEVCVYPSLVQGISAAANIIDNLKLADESHHDVILLARGGGAIEDLWCFNEESVARAILAMQTVIVTGIGHETDTTLADYVSDARAATPTAGAELITPDMQEVSYSLAKIKRQMKQQIESMLAMKKQELEHRKAHRYLQDPLSYIQKDQLTLAMHIKSLSITDTIVMEQRKQLDALCHSLGSTAQKINSDNHQRVQSYRDTLKHTIEYYTLTQKKQFQNQLSLLDAFSPLKILERGYAISYHKDQLVKSATQVDAGDELRVRMHDGILVSTITKKEDLS